MRKTAVLHALVCAVLLCACATLERSKPLTDAQVVELAKSGKTSQQIIEELKRTDTVLALQASDFLKLHEAGVPVEVLDHLQRAQIEDIRWRERHSRTNWDTFHGGFGSWPRR